METNESLLNPELQIDDVANSYLSETAKWAKFLGIVGFVISALLTLGALFSGILFSSFSEIAGSGAFLSATFFMIVYLIAAAVNFFMSLFLYRFSIKMKLALNNTDQDALNTSFLNLKNLYKMAGILVIIYLVCIVLMMVFAIGAAVLMR